MLAVTAMLAVIAAVTVTAAVTVPIALASTSTTIASEPKPNQTYPTQHSPKTSAITF